MLLTFSLGALGAIGAFASAALGAASPDAFPEGMLEALRTAADRVAWPGFRPERMAYAVFDGADTWLLQHPDAPEGYETVRDGVARRAGRDPVVTANSSALLGGTMTATVLLKPEQAADLQVVAALMVHEAFHVFEQEHLPSWGANEADLFTYPGEDAEALALRRLEGLALMKACAAEAEELAAGWARAAWKCREQRFARLPESSAEYERALESHEGVPMYLQVAAEGSSRAPRLAPYAPEDVRSRCYESGRAWLLLLDRLAPGWKESIGSGEGWRPDRQLAAVLGTGPTSAFLTVDREREELRARDDARALAQSRVEARETFLASEGWRISVDTTGGPILMLRGFDPLNVVRLEGGEVLHERMLSLACGSGTLEVLGRKALTTPAGEHPLYNGVRKVVLTGFAAEPGVAVEGERVHFADGEVRLTFAPARLEREGKELRILLGRATPTKE